MNEKIKIIDGSFKIDRVYQQPGDPLPFWKRVLAFFKNELYSKKEMYHYDVSVTVDRKLSTMDMVKLQNGLGFYIYNILELDENMFRAMMKTYSKTSITLINEAPDYLIRTASLGK